MRPLLGLAVGLLAVAGCSSEGKHELRCPVHLAERKNVVAWRDTGDPSKHPFRHEFSAVELGVVGPDDPKDPDRFGVYFLGGEQGQIVHVLGRSQRRATVTLITTSAEVLSPMTVDYRMPAEVWGNVTQTPLKTTFTFGPVSRAQVQAVVLSVSPPMLRGGVSTTSVRLEVPGAE